MTKNPEGPKGRHDRRRQARMATEAEDSRGVIDGLVGREHPAFVRPEDCDPLERAEALSKTLPNLDEFDDETLARLTKEEIIDAYQTLYEQAGKANIIRDDARLDPAIDRYLKQITGQAAAFESNEIAERGGLTKQQADFIQAYVSNGGLTHSALATASATRLMYQQWLKEPAFNDALEEATTKWFEELRKSAFLRAQAKSDVLLIFLLKALKPEVYDDDIRKAQWLAKNGLLGSENLPVRATLVRDNTFNVQINANAAPGPVEIARANDLPKDPNLLDPSGPEDHPNGREVSHNGREVSPNGREVSVAQVARGPEVRELDAVSEIAGSKLSPVSAQSDESKDSQSEELRVIEEPNARDFDDDDPESLVE